MERLVAAAAEEAEERGYADISVRTIAKRAGVAPATAYTYFSGKDHLLAEVLWRCVQSSPHLVDLTLDLPERVAETARTMGFAPMGRRRSPRARRRCWATAPTSSGCGRASAWRSGGGWPPPRWCRADPAVLPVLQATYTGALHQRGHGAPRLRRGAAAHGRCHGADDVGGDRAVR